MRKSGCVVAGLLGLLALPPTVAGQTSYGVLLKAGTLGAGADAAVGVGGRLDLRGGVGFWPIDFDDQTINDISFDLDLPSTYASVGVDLYPTGGGLRLSGGLMFRPDEPVITGRCTGTREFGGTQYDCSQVGELTGTIESSSAAPFVSLGFGRVAGSGVGFFLEIGGAFMGSPTVEITADGPLAADQQFQRSLEEEEADFEDDLGPYLKVHPMVQLGVRIGLGG